MLINLIKENHIPFSFSLIQLLCFVLYCIYDVPAHAHVMLSWETFVFLVGNLVLLVVYIIVFLCNKQQTLIIWMIPFILFLMNIYSTTG